MRSRTAIAACTALVLVAAVNSCSRNSGNSEATTSSAVESGARQTAIIATEPQDSQGPAADVIGATMGGTFTVIRENKISHLDPQRIYSFAGLMNAALYARTLTVWKDDGHGGLTLVGDLATGTGNNVDKDCTVWEFTIKDGLKFEDGRPITAHEIAYGIARSFDPDLTGGPTYLQEWLAGTPQYDTAWDFKANKSSLPPGLTTPDAHTLRFEFDKPHCDLPFAVSLPASAPVPPEKDTGVDYDNQPISSGPYKITENTPGVQLVLERNTNWDPATDPVRHQYPDRFVWTFGPDGEAAANRIIADSGTDQSALDWNSVPSSLVSKTAPDPALQQRSLLAPTTSANRLTINNQRVTDLTIRQAINYAIDREGLIKTLGGQTVGSPITTLMPPGTLGYQEYDAYPAGPNGNIDRAKELLAGRTPELVLGAADDSTGQEIATQLKGNLEKAGFIVTVKNIPADNKLDETKKKDNPWDIYLDSWAADWPSGAAILPVLFDGRAIKAEGNSNSSLMNSDAINAEFDRVLAMDPAKQASEWGTVDERIMTEVAPVVPLYVDVAYFLHGSKAGGLFISGVFPCPAFVDAYVMQ